MIRRARRRAQRTLRNRALIKFTYKPQYGVIVTCADEPEQRRVYERLHRSGLRCKVVTV